MVTWRHYLIICLISLIVTVVMVPLVRRIALHFDIVDYPGPRRVNKKPIPRMGGVAMFIGALVALFIECVLDATGIWSGPMLENGVLSTKLIGVFVGLCFVVVVGVIDDVRSLPPLVKLIGQILAACIIAFTGTLLSNFKIPFSNVVVYLDAWAYPITIIYLVAFANIINLIDGLDGLAAGVSGIAALSLFALMASLQHGDAALLALIVVGICIGFLFYNFNPASIFMGDSGSLLLGMMLGTISLLGSARFSSVTALLVPIIIAGIPVLDTFSAIVRRVREHKPIQVADAGHIHHRLLRRGFSQRKSVLIIYGLTALLCGGATIIWQFGGVTKYLVLIALIVCSLYIIWYLGLFGPVLRHHYGDGSDDDSSSDESAPDEHDEHEHE